MLEYSAANDFAIFTNSVFTTVDFWLRCKCNAALYPLLFSLRNYNTKGVSLTYVYRSEIYFKLCKLNYCKKVFPVLIYFNFRKFGGSKEVWDFGEVLTKLHGPLCSFHLKLHCPLCNFYIFCTFDYAYLEKSIIFAIRKYKTLWKIYLQHIKT